MLNKNAISSVVATIMIIMITIVAGVLVVTIVVPMIKENLTEGTECFDYLDYFIFEEEDFAYNCYRDEGNYLYGISIRTDSVSGKIEEEIGGFKILFTKSGNSRSVAVEENQTAKSNDGEIRMLDSSLFVLNVPGSGEVRTYVYNSSELFETVEVYPLLKSGRMCDRSDEIRIEGTICAPSKPLT